MERKYIHRLEGRVREVRLQDVFDGDNVVMFEMLEDLQLSQCAFGICQHLKGIGDLLYCHLLAWTNTAGKQDVQLSLNNNVKPVLNFHI